MSDFPIVTLTPRPFAFVTITTPMPEIARAMGEGFGRLAGLFQKAGAEMAGMPHCHYVAYDTASTTFQLGFPARPDQVASLREAGLEIGETPKGKLMQAVHMGPYDTVVATYNEMTAQMEKKHLQGTRDMWEVYYSPPETPSAEIKTEILWPIEKAA